MFYIETLQGYRYFFEDNSIKPLKLEIESLSPITIFETIEDRDGVIDLGTTLHSRKLIATFSILAIDKDSYYIARNEVFRLFDARSYFYLIDVNEPSKRWKVKTASPFQIQKINAKTGTFEIPLISPSPFAESITSTLNPKWNYQVSTHELVQYKFNNTKFKVWNDGEKVDPRQVDLKIYFKGVSSDLTITNQTTGDIWKYNGLTNENDIILLDGIRSLKNGFSVFKDTNKKLICLEKYWNHFEISGAENFEISFDFRFHYI